MNTTTPTPGAFRVQLDFADDADLLRFTKFATQAKEMAACPGQLTCSLAAAAVSRATVKPVPAGDTPGEECGALQDLISAAQLAADAMRNMRQGRFQGATAGLDKAVAMFKGKATP